jgi:transcriptional regulator with XRE-family HTH domain
MSHSLLEPGEIRRQREELGLTQQRLAELSGLSLRTIVRLERGENKRGGTTDTLGRILEVLDTVEHHSTCTEGDCCGRCHKLSSNNVEVEHV